MDVEVSEDLLDAHAKTIASLKNAHAERGGGSANLQNVEVAGPSEFSFEIINWY